MFSLLLRAAVRPLQVGRKLRLYLHPRPTVFGTIFGMLITFRCSTGCGTDAVERRSPILVFLRNGLWNEAFGHRASAGSACWWHHFRRPHEIRVGRVGFGSLVLPSSRYLPSPRICPQPISSIVRAKRFRKVTSNRVLSQSSRLPGSPFVFNLHDI
ncbi:hypothetical protein EDB89DRAFT_1516910 [Lactarius sanguifluus]|nr:hypothetical protein EDB89DRAFT_1516910 [Lactarius sanguifluus]